MKTDGLPWLVLRQSLVVHSYQIVSRHSTEDLAQKVRAKAPKTNVEVVLVAHVKKGVI